MVLIYLTSWETAKLFSKVGIPFYFPISNIWSSQFLQSSLGPIFSFSLSSLPPSCFLPFLFPPLFSLLSRRRFQYVALASLGFSVFWLIPTGSWGYRHALLQVMCLFILICLECSKWSCFLPPQWLMTLNIFFMVKFLFYCLAFKFLLVSCNSLLIAGFALVSDCFWFLSRYFRKWSLMTLSRISYLEEFLWSILCFFFIVIF